MSADLFVLPTAPSGNWEELTPNEKGWIEFIRVISGGRDPRPTPARIRELVRLLDAS